jgi:hypothetical protein
VLKSLGHFSRHEPGIFGAVLETLLSHGDFSIPLADLPSFTVTQSDARWSLPTEEPDRTMPPASLGVRPPGGVSSLRARRMVYFLFWEALSCECDRTC